jgi:hypothetical protein
VDLVQLKKVRARSLLLLLFFLLEAGFKFGEVQMKGVHGLPLAFLPLLINIGLSFGDLVPLERLHVLLLLVLFD